MYVGMYVCMEVKCVSPVMEMIPSPSLSMTSKTVLIIVFLFGLISPRIEAINSA